MTFVVFTSYKSYQKDNISANKYFFKTLSRILCHQKFVNKFNFCFKMFWVGILFSALFLQFDGINAIYHGKIIAEKDLQDIEEVPYLLSLTEGDRHICAAVVVDQKWALTSARCVTNAFNYPKSDLSLRSLSSSIQKSGHIQIISKIEIHPFFNRTLPDFDFALLKVSTDFPAQCKVVGLPPSWTEPNSDKNALVLGWGGPFKYKQMITVLVSSDVDIVSRKICQTIDLERRNDRPKNARLICASKSKDFPCIGDNGGPLMIGNMLVGISAQRTRCAVRDYPNVYGNVGNYYVRSWITKIIKGRRLW